MCQYITNKTFYQLCLYTTLYLLFLHRIEFRLTCGNRLVYATGIERLPLLLERADSPARGYYSLYSLLKYFLILEYSSFESIYFLSVICFYDASILSTLDI